MERADHSVPEQRITRASSSEPSLPRRDSITDANPRLTRKRPRLDSGDDRAVRSMSADAANGMLEGSNTGTSQETSLSPLTTPKEESNRTLSAQVSPDRRSVQSSKVTINVRQPHVVGEANSNIDNQDEEDIAQSVEVAVPEEMAEQTINGANEEADATHDIAMTADSPTLSPEAVPIEIEAGEPEFIGEDPVDGIVDIDEALNDNVDRFPYSNNTTPTGAARLVASHFDKETMNGDVIPQLLVWLEQHLELTHAYSSRWLEMYSGSKIFWNNVGDAFCKLATRRLPLVDQRSDARDLNIQMRKLQDLLLFYVRLCHRFIYVDLQQFAIDASAGRIAIQDLLGTRHLKALSMFLRNSECNLWGTIEKVHEYSVTPLIRRLQAAFSSYKPQGPENLLRLADVLGGFIGKQAGFCNPLLSCLSLMTTLAESLLGLLNARDELAPDNHSTQLPALAYNTFASIDENLQACITRQNSTLPVEFCREAVLRLASILEILSRLDSDSAARAHDVYVDRPEEFSEALPELVANAWKFKILQRFVTKGRMELRVLGIEMMCNELIGVYRRYYQDLEIPGPVISYLTKFLLDQRLVDYIVGVDSHPQLISRSGNIVGFLAATKNHTKKETDKIWATIETSSDPRVVTATVLMLREILNLFSFEELIYFCKKLQGMPLESFKPELVSFMNVLFEKLRGKEEWNIDSSVLESFNLCIRLLQQSLSVTAPTGDVKLINETAHQNLAECSRRGLGLADRQLLYEVCFQEIAKKTPAAAGSMQAINTIANFNNDFDMLTGTFDIVGVSVEEFCSYIDQQSQRNALPDDQWSIGFRLNFIFGFLLKFTSVEMPGHLDASLWEHAVGKSALNAQMRDITWRKLVDRLRMRSVPDEFVERWIAQHLPSLEPQYYTKGLFDFLSTSAQWHLRCPESSGFDAPIFDQIWRIMLDAPTGTIEIQLRKLLVQLYVESHHVKKGPVVTAETTHQIVVKRCFDDLFSALRQAADRLGELSPGDSDALRRRIARLLAFLGDLLKKVRLSTLFNQPVSHSPKSVNGRVLDSVGEPIAITYQATASKPRSVTVGDLESLSDFVERMKELTGFTSFWVINGGAKLDIITNATQTLRELRIGRSGLVLIHKRQAAVDAVQEPARAVGNSAIETEIIQYLDELSEFMTSEDEISRSIFEFLSYFPPQSKIRQRITAEDSTPEELFPVGRGYTTRLSISALNAQLKEQLKTGMVNEQYLSHAISLLEALILGPQLSPEALTVEEHRIVANEAFACLLGFLKERPQEQTLTECFSNANEAVDRLSDIIRVSQALPATSSDSAALTQNAYAVIIEACLRNRKVWEAFTEHTGVVELHQKILLEEPRQQLQDALARTIEGVCGDVDLSTTVRATEFASFYWRVLSACVTPALQYPTTCGRFFSVALKVFRVNSELRTDEDLLRSYLVSWGNFLLQHPRSEVVGSETTDEVVGGLARLVGYCIQVLKSFKKPLNTGNLSRQLFRRLLFTPLTSEVSEEDNNNDFTTLTPILPVLDVQARQEIYNILVSLCDNLDSYGELIELIDSVALDTDVGWNYERSRDIRSTTGFVGIKNLGNTCYMNSLLTQLFMNVNFRRFVLKTPVADENAQRLLFETQRLFAYMQESYQKGFDASDFANTIRTYDNRSIDVNVQMDVDEFYNLLFDRWEGQMLSEDAKQAFRSFYGGQSVNQIKSRECPHVSERVESFFAIQCDVKGKANLEDSLRAYVEGDVMEGDNKYKCESCGGRFVEAVKRTGLKDLPDNLIFHLKRFDFDLQTMLRSKVNDYFEFPPEIDMSPYKLDRLNNPEVSTPADRFQLVGVLVHQGTAESGHYYSYIKVRPHPSNKPPTWVEFNDHEVAEFEAEKIADMGFGGTTEYTYQNARYPKAWNAYMLFYERIKAVDPMDVDSTLDKVPIPPILAAEIEVDNEERVRRYCQFDLGHMAFVRTVINQLQSLTGGSCTPHHTYERRTLTLAQNSLELVICRAKDTPELQNMLVTLKRLIGVCPECCQLACNLMSSKQDTCRHLLLRCPVGAVRHGMADYLCNNLTTLKKHDIAAYGLDDNGLGTPQSESEFEGCFFTETSPFRRLLLALFQIKDTLGIISRSWEDYFGLLGRLAMFGQEEALEMISEGFFQMCLEIFTVHERSWSQDRHPKVRRIIETKRPDWNKLIELFYMFLQRIDLDLDPTAYKDERWVNRNRLENKLPLNNIENDLLRYWNNSERTLVALAKLIEAWNPSKSKSLIPGQVLSLILAAEPDFGLFHKMYAMLDESIREYGPEFAEAYLRAAVYFCKDAHSVHEVLDLIETAWRSMWRPDNSTVASMGHFDFFFQVAHIANMRLEPDGGRRFRNDLVKCARSWAYPLMLSEVQEMRDGTKALFEDLVLSQPITTEVDNEEDAALYWRQDVLRAEAVRDMIRACLPHVNSAFDTGHNRRMVQAMIDTTLQCAQYLLQIKLDDDTERLRKSTDDNLIARVAHWFKVVPALQGHALHSNRADLEGAVEMWANEDDELAASDSDVLLSDRSSFLFSSPELPER